MKIRPEKKIIIRVRESSKTKGDIDINRPSKRPITWRNALSWKVAIFPLAEISIVGCFIEGCCSQEIFVFPSGVEIHVFLDWNKIIKRQRFFHDYGYITHSPYIQSLKTASIYHGPPVAFVQAFLQDTNNDWYNLRAMVVDFCIRSIYCKKLTYGI